MLYRISVAERGLTGIANIFRSRLRRLDDLLRAGTVPLTGASRVSDSGALTNSPLPAHLFQLALTPAISLHG